LNKKKKKPYTDIHTSSQSARTIRGASGLIILHGSLLILLYITFALLVWVAYDALVFLVSKHYSATHHPPRLFLSSS
jgi:hypothetical protein